MLSGWREIDCKHCLGLQSSWFQRDMTAEEKVERTTLPPPQKIKLSLRQLNRLSGLSITFMMPLNKCAFITGNLLFCNTGSHNVFHSGVSVVVDDNCFSFG